MDKHHRILIVDDNKSIHEDIKSVLTAASGSYNDELRSLEESLFDDLADEEETGGDEETHYVIDDAYQGEEAIEMIDSAQQEGNPYSLVFMDVRMPPGIDGIQTTKKLWQDHPFLETVICTAYSDYSWSEIVQTLGKRDNLLFIKKPFDTTALKQVALNLATKWCLKQESLHYVENLEKEVEKRTIEMSRTIAELMASLSESDKRMSEKKRQAQSFRSLLEALPTGVLGIDEYDRVFCCNRKFASAMGMGDRDVTDRPISELDFDWDFKAVNRFLDEAKQNSPDDDRSGQIAARANGKAQNLCITTLVRDGGKYAGMVLTLP